MNGCIVFGFAMALYQLVGTFAFTLAINSFGGDLRFLFCLLMSTPLLISNAVVTSVHIRRRYCLNPKTAISTLLLTIPASTLATVLVYAPVFLRMDAKGCSVFAASLAVSAVVAGPLQIGYVDMVRCEIPLGDDPAGPD